MKGKPIWVAAGALAMGVLNMATDGAAENAIYDFGWKMNDAVRGLFSQGNKPDEGQAAAGQPAASRPTTVGSPSPAPGNGPENNNDDNNNNKPTLQTNPKHNPNSKSPQPENVKDLFNKSVVDKNGVRWTKDADGTIHSFSKPSNGETHWNGSTAGQKPIRTEDIPIEIRRTL